MQQADRRGLDMGNWTWIFSDLGNKKVNTGFSNVVAGGMVFKMVLNWDPDQEPVWGYCLVLFLDNPLTTLPVCFSIIPL